MSLSLIAFQPAIDEPSNIWPSDSVSSSTRLRSKVTCCNAPRGSVKRKSTYLTSFSLISASILAGVVMLAPIPLSLNVGVVIGAALDRRGTRFSGADAHHLGDLRDEDLAVADAAGAGGRLDRLEAGLQLAVGHHHFDLQLRQEIDDVLGPAVELGMALLASVALGFQHRHALDAQLLQ